MRIRRDFDNLEQAIPGKSNDVEHERPADSLSHERWIDKEILELDGVPKDAKRSETDDQIVGIGRHSGSLFLDAYVGVLKRFTVRQKDVSVSRIG